MEIPLPSGASITVKDNTVPGDRFAVQDAPETVVEDGRVVIRNAEGNAWKAFLTRIVTAWSFPVPIPAVAGPGVLDEYPDREDDDDALREALRERYERITRRRPTTQSPPAPTGGTSTVS